MTVCVSRAETHWAPSAHALRNDRLHLQYGPIDVLIDVDADTRSILAAHQAAHAAFDGVLEALVNELAVLRSPIGAHSSKTAEISRLS